MAKILQFPTPLVDVSIEVALLNHLDAMEKGTNRCVAAADRAQAEGDPLRALEWVEIARAYLGEAKRALGELEALRSGE